ncbi:MAG: thioredoxin family protein [Moheibacter sp.]
MKKIGLILFLSAFGFAGAQQTAEEIIGTAAEQAKIENKNVLVFFHASWCGWCRRMEENMENEMVKDYFDNNFEKAFLTVQETPKNKNLETPGGEEVLDRLGGNRHGLPYWVILSPDGKILADSKVNGQNLGCPADEKEVAAMISKFKDFSPNLELKPDLIREVFVMK